MIILGSILAILVISVFLAVRSVNHELSVPDELVKLKIDRKKPLSGVILFLKKKIVHYSSAKSS